MLLLLILLRIVINKGFKIKLKHTKAPLYSWHILSKSICSLIFYFLISEKLRKKLLN